MKNELNLSYNGGGDAYLLRSVAVHFNHTVGSVRANLSHFWRANNLVKFQEFQKILLKT